MFCFLHWKCWLDHDLHVPGHDRSRYVPRCPYEATTCSFPDITSLPHRDQPRLITYNCKGNPLIPNASHRKYNGLHETTFLPAVCMIHNATSCLWLMKTSFAELTIYLWSDVACSIAVV